jgi:hypothetical protein
VEVVAGGAGGPDGELERAIASGVHNDLEWTSSEQRRGAEQLR